MGLLFVTTTEQAIEPNPHTVAASPSSRSPPHLSSPAAGREGDDEVDDVLDLLPWTPVDTGPDGGALVHDDPAFFVDELAMLRQHHDLLIVPVTEEEEEEEHGSGAQAVLRGVPVPRCWACDDGLVVREPAVGSGGRLCTMCGLLYGPVVATDSDSGEFVHHDDADLAEETGDLEVDLDFGDASIVRRGW